MQPGTKKPVKIEIIKQKLVGKQDRCSDYISSINKVYWSKKKSQIVASVVTKAKETATVVLDELRSEPAELFTEFMKNLIMEEVRN